MRTLLLTLSILLLGGLASAAPVPPPAHPDATFATHDTDPQPTIRIVHPQQGQVLPAGEPVMVEVDLRGLTLAPDGFHVHVWLNDEPYRAMYDATKPFVIGELPPGVHSIRVAPSRPWHELFKNPGAFDGINFIVEGGGVHHSFIDHNLPTLTYSRPKKNLTHTWEQAQNLILDWYISGVTLGEDGVYLRVTIDDAMTYLLTSWSPLFIEKPMPGTHTITLELMQHGKLLPANFNPFTASYTILPPGEGGGGHGGHH